MQLAFPENRTLRTLLDKIMNIWEKLKDKRLLLIDDDESIRDSMCLFFLNEGCHLQAFDTAEKGMEAIGTGPFDIIITDYRLPGISGLEFAKNVKMRYPETRLVLITAYLNERLTSKARELGFDELIKKPFTTVMIEKALSGLMERSN